MGKKIEGLQRMLVIINKLKGLQRYVSREELERYVSLRMEEREGTPVDLRTLQRDFNEIDSLLASTSASTKSETVTILMKKMSRRKSSMNDCC